MNLSSFINLRCNLRFVPLFAIILMTACGGGDPSDAADTVDVFRSYEITSFNVTGTSADNASGQTPINPAVNNGEINISWMVRDQYQNTIRLVVSEDTALSGDDEEIFFSVCNPALPCGEPQPEMTCTFSMSNVMSCWFQDNSLADFLDAIPKDAFIIIESCFNGYPGLCETRSKAVQFQ